MTATEGIRVGVVATNQERKEWPLAVEVCTKLREVVTAAGKDFTCWFHIDTLKRAYDLDALIADYDLANVVEVTLAPMDESELVRRYRTCDVTLATGSEGFGYPIFESLACGVPCVHGDYAAGASLLRTCGLEALLVRPVAWRLEGPYNAKRPVYVSADWVWRVVNVLETRDQWREQVAHLDWPALGPRFQQWFDAGIQVVQI